MGRERLAVLQGAACQDETDGNDVVAGLYKLPDLAFEEGQRLIEDGTVTVLPEAVRHSRQLVVDAGGGAFGTPLDLGRVTRLGEVGSQRPVPRRKDIQGEVAGLAQVSQGGAAALKGAGDEARLEGNLHDPVGHHAVDVVGAAGADDVKAVRHELQGFDNGVNIDFAGGHAT